MKKTRFHLCATCGSMPLSAQREKKSVCSSLRDLHTWREGIEREAEREAGIVPVSSEAGRWKGAIEGREIGNLRALHRRDGPWHVGVQSNRELQGSFAHTKKWL